MEEAIKKLEEIVDELDRDSIRIKKLLIARLEETTSDYPVNYCDSLWNDYRTCLENKIAIEAAIQQMMDEN
jgi:hypothetical protein